MVKYAQILSTNSSFFATNKSSNLVAAFVGATHGIGFGALQAFAKHTSGSSATAYVVGRSQKSLDNVKSPILALNSSLNFIPVLTNDLTLVKDAQAAAERIAGSASKIDLLVMSPGYVSLGREESPEGIDKVTAIRYYSRMRILQTLAPSLLKSQNPRVVNVLGAGQEGKLFPDDWLLKNNYGLANAGGAAGTMTTLFLEEFSRQPGNEALTLAHTFPGMVGGTNLQLTGLPGWGKFLFDWVAGPLIKLFGYSVEEAGERTLYAATAPHLVSKKLGASGTEVATGSDGKQGSGVYLLGGDSEICKETKDLKEQRAQAQGVWKHTSEVFEKVERGEVLSG